MPFDAAAFTEALKTKVNTKKNRVPAQSYVSSVDKENPGTEFDEVKGDRFTADGEPRPIAHDIVKADDYKILGPSYPAAIVTDNTAKPKAAEAEKAKGKVESDNVSQDEANKIHEKAAKMLVKAKLSSEERNSLGDETFCGPDRSFPVPDSAHVTAARRLVDRSHNSDQVKSKIRACVERKASAMNKAEGDPQPLNVKLQNLWQNQVDRQDRIADSDRARNKKVADDELEHVDRSHDTEQGKLFQEAEARSKQKVDDAQRDVRLNDRQTIATPDNNRFARDAEYSLKQGSGFRQSADAFAQYKQDQGYADKKDPTVIHKTGSQVAGEVADDEGAKPMEEQGVVGPPETNKKGVANKPMAQPEVEPQQPAQNPNGPEPVMNSIRELENTQQSLNNAPEEDKPWADPGQQKRVDAEREAIRARARAIPSSGRFDQKQGRRAMLPSVQEARQNATAPPKDPNEAKMPYEQMASTIADTVDAKVREALAEVGLANTPHKDRPKGEGVTIKKKPRDTADPNLVGKESKLIGDTRAKAAKAKEESVKTEGVKLTREQSEAAQRAHDENEAYHKAKREELNQFPEKVIDEKSGKWRGTNPATLEVGDRVIDPTVGGQTKRQKEALRAVSRGGIGGSVNQTRAQGHAPLGTSGAGDKEVYRKQKKEILEHIGSKVDDLPKQAYKWIPLPNGEFMWGGDHADSEDYDPKGGVRDVDMPGKKDKDGRPLQIHLAIPNTAKNRYWLYDEHSKQFNIVRTKEPVETPSGVITEEQFLKAQGEDKRIEHGKAKQDYEWDKYNLNDRTHDYLYSTRQAEPEAYQPVKLGENNMPEFFTGNYPDGSQIKLDRVDTNKGYFWVRNPFSDKKFPWEVVHRPDIKNAEALTTGIISWWQADPTRTTVPGTKGAERIVTSDENERDRLEYELDTSNYSKTPAERRNERVAEKYPEQTATAERNEQQERDYVERGRKMFEDQDGTVSSRLRNYRTLLRKRLEPGQVYVLTDSSMRGKGEHIVAYFNDSTQLYHALGSGQVSRRTRDNPEHSITIDAEKWRNGTYKLSLGANPADYRPLPRNEGLPSPASKLPVKPDEAPPPDKELAANVEESAAKIGEKAFPNEPAKEEKFDDRFKRVRDAVERQSYNEAAIELEGLENWMLHDKSKTQRRKVSNREVLRLVRYFKKKILGKLKTDRTGTVERLGDRERIARNEDRKKYSKQFSAATDTANRITRALIRLEGERAAANDDPAKLAEIDQREKKLFEEKEEAMGEAKTARGQHRKDIRDNPPVVGQGPPPDLFSEAAQRAKEAEKEMADKSRASEKELREATVKYKHWSREAKKKAAAEEKARKKKKKAEKLEKAFALAKARWS